GRIVYLDDKERLVSQRIAKDGSTLIGKPEVYTDARYPITSGADGTFFASASANGILAYVDAPVTNTQVVELDRHGRRVRIVPLPAGRYQTLSVSPDGKRLAVQRGSGEIVRDLWMADVETGALNRLTPNVYGTVTPASNAWTWDETR